MMKTSLCYYCNKNAPDPTSVFRKMLYKKIDSSYGIGFSGIKKTTKYYEKEMQVDRCASCAEEHKRANMPVGYIFLAFLVISCIMMWYCYINVINFIIMNSMAGISAIGAYIMMKKRIKNLGIKDSNTIKEYLPVKQLLDEGWQTHKPD